MTNIAIAMEAMALIEIDGLPTLKMGGSVHGYVKKPDGRYIINNFEAYGNLSSSSVQLLATLVARLLSGNLRVC